MSLPSHRAAPEPKEREKRRRPVYRVESEPGADPAKGEELLLKWLASLASE